MFIDVSVIFTIKKVILHRKGTRNGVGKSPGPATLGGRPPPAGLSAPSSPFLPCDNDGRTLLKGWGTASGRTTYNCASSPFPAGV